MRKRIYEIGERLRNPSTKEVEKFLFDSDFWTLKQLEDYQESKFLELIYFCFEHNKFYQKKFQELGLTKDSFKSIDDLKKLPIITKADLVQNSDLLHSKYKFKKVFKASTSGSSGESLEYYRNEEADTFSRVSAKRGYSWYGVHPSDFNGYFWGFNFSFIDRVKTRFLDYVQNRIRVFSYNEREFRLFVKKIKHARYLQGYSSMIYQTAKLILKYQLDKPKKLKLIKGTSEKILPAYQEEIKNAFGIKMISEYGATESGIIAFECPEGNMHINQEGVIVESIDQEIVVTNLHLKSFPIIRYKLGDYIELAPDEYRCTCGRHSKIIREVTGRVGENIVGHTGKYPTLTLYYIFKNLSKNYNIQLHYQAVQNSRGNLDIYIKQTIDDRELNLLKKEIHKYFKGDVDCFVHDQVHEFQGKGKIRDFISKL